MSQGEEKVLKDLVTHCLASKGFLSKIEAEIRAAVFVALEEQDVLKDVILNKPLRDFIQTTHGALVINLVREFLEFFNLQFTNMVFDRETQSGIDYKFEGRSKLAKDLNLSSEQDTNVPLLGLLLQSVDSVNRGVAVVSSVNGPELINKHSTENGEINTLDSNDLKLIKEAQDSTVYSNNKSGHKNANEITEEVNFDAASENKTFLSREIIQTSLSDLPPLNSTKPHPNDESSLNIDMKKLNELLQFEPDGGDANYEEDFVSSGSDKKDGKSDSAESEVEEELPSNSNHSNGEDLTADLTISKASDQADYMENISSS